MNITPLRATGALALAATLVACGIAGNDPLPAPTTTAADAWANAVAYTRAVWAGDTEAALRLAAPGTPAERYAAVAGAAAQARLDAGEELAPTTVTDDPAKRKVTVTTGEGKVAWRGFAADHDGRVVSWTGPAGPVSEALWRQDAMVGDGTNTVSLVGAYLDDDGHLVVVLDVQAGTEGAEATRVDYDADGKRAKLVEASVPGFVPPGGSGLHRYEFRRTDLDGNLWVGLTDVDSEPRAALLLPVR